FGDNKASIVYQMDLIRKLIESQSYGSFSLPSEEVSDRLWRGISDFETEFSAEVTLQVSVLPNQITNVFSEGESLLKNSGLGFSIIAHTANGVVYIYIKHVSEDSSRARVIDVIRKLRARFSNEGHVIVERAPVEIK